LHLVLGARGGETYVVRASAGGPLKVLRPFLLPDGRAVVQVVHVGPGLLGGDELRVSVCVEAGAGAVVVSQSATKVLGMRLGQRACHRVTLLVHEGGALEYYPGLVIPFAGAELLQDQEVLVEGGGRVGVLDLWAAGRIARGEVGRFRRLSARLHVKIDGRPVYADALELEPITRPVEGWGLLEGHRYLASGYWQWGDVPEDMVQEEGLLLAWGRTAGGGTYLRALARDGLAMREALGRVLQTWRDLWGLPPVDLARYSSA